MLIEIAVIVAFVAGALFGLLVRFRWSIAVPVAAAIACALLITSARAQEYAAPDAELWRQMTEVTANVPMSLSAHQQVQRIFADVQREAQTRAARAKGAEQSKEKKD